METININLIDTKFPVESYYWDTGRPDIKIVPLKETPVILLQIYQPVPYTAPDTIKLSLN